MVEERLSPVAVVDTLLRSARLARAMHDATLAIDLYDLTARVAVRAGLAAVAPGDERRGELEAILAPDRAFPVFTLVGQRTDWPALRAEGIAQLAALARLLDAATDGLRVVSWPNAREACALLRGIVPSYLPCTFVALDAGSVGDAQPIWRAAQGALEELLAVSPVPLVMEPVATIGQHATDKQIYCLTGVGAGFQDAGWAYDRLLVERARLAIARVALPPAEQGAYVRRYAEVHFERGDIERAEDLLRESLAVAPNAEDHNALLRYLLASPRASDVEFFEESRRWAALYAHEERLQTVTYRNDRARDRPLNVGYMCDFVHTPLAQHTLVPQFRVHDRASVRVYYYNHGPDSDTARAVSDVYRDVRGLDDDGLFRQIQSDGVDILVDLNGRLRVDNRYDVLCRKPAPIQVNWYNLLASTGLRAFDFIVADSVTLPGHKQALCTEEIVHIACGATGSWRLPETPAVGPQPCLSKGAFVFASFGAAFKNNRAVLDLWCRLLRETSDTILYVKNTAFYAPTYKQQVRDYFVSRGISPQRLRLENGSKFHDMRALYADVDLCLDTFPYGNGSTTINALWQGVPTVSLDADEWRARLSVSIMVSAGLGEFVVRTPDEYLERARHYVTHPERLAEIRATIRQTLATSGYYNIEIFTRDLESAYRQMWHRWLDRSERGAPHPS
jgi:hypothetical protein